MNKILIIAEHDGQSINASTHKCIQCAQGISDGSVQVAVFGHNCQDMAQILTKTSGVENVLYIDRPENAQTLAAVLAPQIVEIAAGFSHIFGPSTTFGKDLMPRVAALLGVGQISDIMEVISATQFKRPIYASNAIIKVTAPTDHVVVATVRTASFTEIGSDGGNAELQTLSSTCALPDHTRFVALAAGDSERPDLQTAATVVSGGRALGSSENFDLIYALADKLGAGVGASRAAVDAGYVANDMQVGQTGKIIAPDLYIAVGISGAIQHLTGIKDAGTIVAINKDPDAPIFEVADIGLVGDLFKILPELTAALD